MPRAAVPQGSVYSNRASPQRHPWQAAFGLTRNPFPRVACVITAGDLAAEGFVYWAERDNKRYRLVASPIDIAETLPEHHFGRLDTAVLTSATLSASGSFSYIKGRIGLDAPTELLLDSPGAVHQAAFLPAMWKAGAGRYQRRI